MHLLDVLVLFSLIQLAVHAVPLRPRDIAVDPLHPLKSVASEILSIATAAKGGLFPPAAESTTSLGLVPVTPSSSQQPLTTSTQTDSGQSTSTLDGSSSASTYKSKSTTVSGAAATPSPTKGASGAASNAGPTPTTGQTSAPSDSSASGVTTDAVVPTTTGGGAGPTSSGSGSGSGNPSGSGSGSGSGSDPSSSSDEKESSGGLSAGETAAAVILPVLALIAIIFILLRFCPPIRKRWDDWRLTRLQNRAYRRALDDPVMSFAATQRDRGLGLGDVEQLMLWRRPLSFGFQQIPQQPQNVKRKPLNWDAGRIGAQGIPAIGVAVPMVRGGGDHRRAFSDISEEGEEAEPYEDARSDRS